MRENQEVIKGSMNLGRHTNIEINYAFNHNLKKNFINITLILSNLQNGPKVQ